MKAIIVDDEALGRDTLASMLKKEFPEIKIVGEASSAYDARIKIQEFKPDVIFLDINMPKLNGFDLVNSFKERDFQFIVVTAHKEYGTDALKMGAIDYLLKPIIMSELKDAVKKVQTFLAEKRSFMNADPLSEKANKLAISTLKGMDFIPFQDILYVSAQINYVDIHMTNGKKITLAKTLKKIEEVLPKTLFCRIHKSTMVNLSHIKTYDNKDNTITMNNQVKLFISRNKHAAFFNAVKENFF